MEILDYAEPVAIKRNPLLGRLSAICAVIFVLTSSIPAFFGLNVKFPPSLFVSMMLSSALAGIVLSIVAVSRRSSRTILAWVFFAIWVVLGVLLAS